MPPRSMQTLSQANDAAVHLPDDQWQCPFYMELNQLHYTFSEQASQINDFVLKEKKSIYSWTQSRPTRTFGESNDQVRDKSEYINHDM